MGAEAAFCVERGIGKVSVLQHFANNSVWHRKQALPTSWRRAFQTEAMGISKVLRQEVIIVAWVHGEGKKVEETGKGWARYGRILIATIRSWALTLSKMESNWRVLFRGLTCPWLTFSNDLCDCCVEDRLLCGRKEIIWEALQSSPQRSVAYSKVSAAEVEKAARLGIRIWMWSVPIFQAHWSTVKNLARRLGRYSGEEKT
jgi:hypothetical protein